AQILELLKSLQRESGMAMLLITHDLGVVRKMADRVYVMNGGRVVEEGLTAHVLENPQHAYTRQLVSAQPKGSPPEPAPGSPAVWGTENFKLWSPSKKGPCGPTVAQGRPLDGVPPNRRAGKTIGGVAKSAPARPRWAWHSCGSSPPRGRSPTSAG